MTSRGTKLAPITRASAACRERMLAGLLKLSALSSNLGFAFLFYYFSQLVMPHPPVFCKNPFSTSAPSINGKTRRCWLGPDALCSVFFFNAHFFCSTYAQNSEICLQLLLSPRTYALTYARFFSPLCSVYARFHRLCSTNACSCYALFHCFSFGIQKCTHTCRPP